MLVSYKCAKEEQRHYAIYQMVSMVDDETHGFRYSFSLADRKSSFIFAIMVS